MTRGIFGRSSLELFAYFDRDSCSWKTSQGTFLSDLETFSETWPDSGTMRNGRVYALRISERPTSVSGCSSSDTWPTPDTGESISGHGARGGGTPNGHQSGVDLKSVSRNWLTPHGMHGTDHAGKTGRGGEFAKQATNWGTPNSHERTHTARRVDSGVQLANQAELWQTPATDSFRSRGGDRKDEMGLDQQARFFPPSPLAPPIPVGQTSSESTLGSRRRLNPVFVEILMGFPPFWTEL